MSKYNRKKSSSSGSKKETIKKEVRRLFHSNPHQISTNAMFRLREKYNDDELIDQIQDTFIDMGKEIRSDARKFARLINQKYSHLNYPLHILLKKALKYKVKHNLDDITFAEFRRVYENEITGVPERKRYQHISLPYTTMSQTLGQPVVDVSDGIRTKNEGQVRDIKDIIRHHAESKQLHQHVVLQSMAYKSCALQALKGEFKPDKHNPYCCVDPMIASLFLPKIKIFEDSVVLSNLSYIIKQRHLKQPISNRNDFFLLNNIVSDPTDVICSGDSATRDLLHRVHLQTSLWKQILSLRNGRYYDCNNNDLNISLDNCKRNNKGNPDVMLYTNDEGSVLQKILGSFGIRPTVCATKPLYTPALNNGTLRVTDAIPKVNSLPFVTLKINPAGSLLKDKQEYNLEDSISQSQFYVEDGIILPKNQKIIYSNNIIIFYVPRRVHTLNILNIIKPNQMLYNKLPATMSGFERINTRVVKFNNSIQLNNTNQTFNLRSAVCLETTTQTYENIQANIITGNSSLIFKENQVDALWYNPRGTNKQGRDNIDPTKPSFNKPITRMAENSNNLSHFGWREKLSTSGIIFVYVTDDDSKGVHKEMHWNEH